MSVRKRFWTGILAILLVMLAITLVTAARMPNEFLIQRSISIAATPEEIFPRLNDFHLWNEWSPWAKLDPNCKVRFSGAESGPGAVFEWDGNDKVGQGRMTIEDATAPQVVHMRIDFVRPFENVHYTELAIMPPAEGAKASQVRWSMRGQRGFLQKAICLIMNMDKMVGGDFERGLMNLKQLCEAPPSSPSTQP